MAVGVGGIVGVVVGCLEDAAARGEDVTGRIGGPGGGGVAAGGGQGRDVVDVDGVGDEEDALDGVVGEGLARGRVEELHCELWGGKGDFRCSWFSRGWG